MSCEVRRKKTSVSPVNTALVPYHSKLVSMTVEVKSFDYNVKRATFVSAVVTLATKVLIIIGLSAILRNRHYSYASQNHNKTLELLHRPSSVPPISSLELELTDEIVGSVIGLFSLSAIFSVVLLVALQKNIKYLFLPWMVMVGIEIGVTLSFFFIQVPGMSDSVEALLRVIGLLTTAIFNTFMLWCVITHYNTLSSKSRLYKNFTMDEVPLQSCAKSPLSNGSANTRF